MALVVPNSPDSTPPEFHTVVEGQGDLSNPGDTSNESVNAYNKRTNVPVTEIRGIKNRPDLPGPPNDGPDLITSNDRIRRRKGNPDWKAPDYRIETARERDTDLSAIVPRSNESSPVPTI
ncbi:hypothetical protein MYRNA_104 [Mycobacterium phage Myrna]|uniref:Uncharacterized protein n=1 Tax=Mycobacterium phage Myrna TaxID=546805 RepID=B5LJA8_9CAUD|nr:gp104 [Mycobacterium phage Myrna]ACH62105.1 hypothetical protein MYRNA_104 [Mycobacterium phage Myrna]